MSNLMSIVIGFPRTETSNFYEATKSGKKKKRYEIENAPVHLKDEKAKQPNQSKELTVQFGFDRFTYQ